MPHGRPPQPPPLLPPPTCRRCLPSLQGTGSMGRLMGKGKVEGVAERPWWSPVSLYTRAFVTSRQGLRLGSGCARAMCPLPLSRLRAVCLPA